MARVGRPRDPEEIRELKENMRSSVAKANRQIKSMREQGFESPSMRKLTEDFHKDFTFSFKGHNSTAQLNKLDKQVQDFLNRSTSSVSGYNKYLKNLGNSLGVDYNKRSTATIDADLKPYTDTISKLGQLQRQKQGEYYPSDMQKKTLDKYLEENRIDLKDIDIDKVAEEVTAMLEEEEQKALNELRAFDEASEFDFDLDW